MLEETEERGAPSMYIVTKELYYANIEKLIEDNDIFCKHIQYLKDLDKILNAEK